MRVLKLLPLFAIIVSQLSCAQMAAEGLSRLIPGPDMLKGTVYRRITAANSPYEIRDGLEFLKTADPDKEAGQVYKVRGKRYLMLADGTFPGLTAAEVMEYTKLTADPNVDTIQLTEETGNENYKEAARKYAAIFNRTMLGLCKFCLFRSPAPRAVDVAE